MAKYRKKPVVIEAVLWDGKAVTANSFIGESYGRVWEYVPTSSDIYIDTLEGSLICRVGDWIIKGVKGELCPCKPDIFRLTHEKVETNQQADHEPH